MNDSLKSYFQMVSDIYELNELHKDVKDDLVDEALALVIKLTAKPDVPVSAIAPLILQLECIALQLKLKAKYYMLYEKTTEGTRKKNIMLTLAEGLQRLADATKYLLKTHG